MEDHWSASQINRAIEEPALTFLRCHYGLRGEVGPAAWRGSAVETACDMALFHPHTSGEELLELANLTYDAEAGEMMNDAIAKQRSQIPRYLDGITDLAVNLGIPLKRQARIEWHPNETELPVIGFMDFEYEHECVDLKTAARKPSFTPNGLIKDKGNHIRQMAIYRAATGKPQKLCYLTPANEPIWYTPSDEELIAALKQCKATLKMMEFINHSAPEDIAYLFPPRNLDSYMWDDETRAKAKEIWTL